MYPVPQRLQNVISPAESVMCNGLGMPSSWMTEYKYCIIKYCSLKNPGTHSIEMELLRKHKSSLAECLPLFALSNI